MQPSDISTAEAIILAAGDGDRFVSGSHEPKLLRRILGVPLVIRTLASARHAGITRMQVVVGYAADRIKRLVETEGPSGVELHFVFNPHWQQENGVSVLAAQAGVKGSRFALLMGDHVFHWRTLRQLLDTQVAPDESLLGVDRQSQPANVLAEATKVATTEGRVVAIGKSLDTYDAVDTGLFVCAPSIFEALHAARASGDTTLSGGVRMLAERRRVRAVDIGAAPWCDVDTFDDLRMAETVVRLLTGVP